MTRRIGLAAALLACVPLGVFAALGAPRLPDSLSGPKPSGLAIEVIMGGTDAVASTAPFAVALRRHSDTKAICAGIIVAARWVLTADHCLRDVADALADLYVRTGFRAKTGKNYALVKTVTKPGVDVALLKLNKAIETPGETITFKTDRIDLPQQAQFAGWGPTKTIVTLEDADRLLPATLQYIDLIAGPAGEDLLGSYGTDGCESPGCGPLPGDTGGPLYVRVGPQAKQLIGMLLGAGDVPKSRGYLRASSICSWVEDNVKPKVRTC
jgi:hypothetical protein